MICHGSFDVAISYDGGMSSMMGCGAIYLDHDEWKWEIGSRAGEQITAKFKIMKET